MGTLSKAFPAVFLCSTRQQPIIWWSSADKLLHGPTNSEFTSNNPLQRRYFWLWCCDTLSVSVRKRSHLIPASVHKRNLMSELIDNVPALFIRKTGNRGMVWIAQHSSPRINSPLRRAVSLCYAKDSLGGCAELDTSSGTLVPPMVKLVPNFDPPLKGPEEITHVK